MNTGFSLQTKLGLIGEAAPDNEAPEDSPIIAVYNYKPGVNWAFGGTYQYAFQKAGGLSVGLLYEQGNFTRSLSYEYKETLPFYRNGTLTQQFVNQSLLIPFSYQLAHKKMGLSLGLIPNIHLRSKVAGRHVSYAEGEDFFDIQSTYVSGNTIKEDWGSIVTTYLERPVSFQWAVGAFYQLSPRCNLMLEYKDFWALKTYC